MSRLASSTSRSSNCKLPAPLSLLVEPAAEQTEQRGFDFRSGICGGGIAARVQVLASDDAYHPACQLVVISAQPVCVPRQVRRLRANEEAAAASVPAQE